MQKGALADRIRELKETERGVESMCREMEEIRSEGISLGMESGMQKGRLQENAISLYKMGMPLEQIAEALKCDVATLQKWITHRE